VVASRPLRRRRCAAPGFNPLHCGAVVASAMTVVSSAPVRRFQSPSLRGSGRFLSPIINSTSLPPLFQSPSLRGSGRFEAIRKALPSLDRLVSIPFIAGQWSLLIARMRADGYVFVSIPFIAGQWSLPRGVR